MDLCERLPEATTGSYAYVWGKLWSGQPQETKLNMSLSCYSPVKIYVNGALFFTSDLHQELFPERRTALQIPVQYGWNDVILQFVKTDVGFGGVFGTGSFKNFPLHFIVPSNDRDGMEGWLYSEAFEEPPAELPRQGMTEEETGLTWYPRQYWSDLENHSGVFARLYGTEEQAEAYAWTTIAVNKPGSTPLLLKGRHDGPITVYLDGAIIYESKATEGELTLPIQRRFGVHHLIIKGACLDSSVSRWGFHLEEIEQESGAALISPYPVAGSRDPYLYLGPFEPGTNLTPAQVQEVHRVFDDGKRGVYYELDQPRTTIRPYLENTHYGKWNYPLGVTLLGLLHTGTELGREDYIRYGIDHISLSTTFDQYGLWDRAMYGAAGINNQLSAIDSLDDCGSFGATMMAAMDLADIPYGRETADRIAGYITEEQERLEDGAFFRQRGSGEMRQETMWCDDLYMSTPFLSRYARLTGDASYLEDAVQQFLLFRKYLYIPKLQVMSHVYDFVRGSATGIPWGRGNGWVLFSLTELLEILPENHAKRSELISFYRDLSEGYLRLQGENGLWHQVLNRPDSYEESSCTSMFIYAYAKGVRNGWLTDPAPYIDAVFQGWRGLTRVAIDAKGNIYGVCRGSGYSFTAAYYKDDLGWNLNDTHGIGIVLLAGVETLRLQNELKKAEVAEAAVVSPRPS
ncbi:glycoside hydrolase family 88/105 protein [Paenibacillus sp. An7]|uniref:glycoside hydrolase family 88/105 protein n=1 Tax=Paenibacillus sp. An7 TaxID=2689577 RepID=UPI001F436C47|nr:glycoside hydrolase family 88 protein [Paenibacillus sp. An7]